MVSRSQFLLDSIQNVLRCDAFLSQIGSYFGSELLSMDVDGDGKTDVLLVAAPMFYSQGWERGKVYIYTVTPQVRCTFLSQPYLVNKMSLMASLKHTMKPTKHLLTAASLAPTCPPVLYSLLTNWPPRSLPVVQPPPWRSGQTSVSCRMISTTANFANSHCSDR